MRIGVESDADIRMSHQVLKHLRVHPGLRHIGAVGVTAHMRRDLRKLHAINAIILLHRMLEVLLPVHRHHRLSILIEPKESGVPVNHGLHLQLRPSGKNALKCFIHIVLHRNHSGTGIGLCRINVNQCPGLLKLMVNVDSSILHIQIMNCQSCKLRYTHPRLEQNVHPVIIPAVVRIIFDKIKERSFLLSCNGFTSSGIVDQHGHHLKLKRILP